MQNEEMWSLKEHGQKGDFLLPFSVVNTTMPDFYTTYPMHWHDEMEIVYVESGEFEETIDLENYRVKKGDIILINPRILHSFRFVDDVRTSFRTILFDMGMLTSNSTDACSINYFLPFLEDRFLTPVIISRDSEHYQELKEAVQLLITAYDDRKKYYEIRIKSGLYQLFYTLFSYYYTPEDHEPSIKDTTTRNIKIILDYIGENYMKPITIEELSEQVNLSKHYFMRFFKKYMGTTCIEYINDYRLNVATHLLLTTNMQITEVSTQIGVSNLSYFNRIFKKKYHMTPKEYRVNVDNH